MLCRSSSCNLELPNAIVLRIRIVRLGYLFPVPLLRYAPGQTWASEVA